MALAKLLIDLEAMKSRIEPLPCSYYHHRENDGITALREQAIFTVFCRHCEEGACIRACPKEALKRGEDKIVRRSTMMCVRCNSCVIACPFGTIQEDSIPYKTSICDFCVGRLRNGEAPICVEKCTDGSVKFGDFKEDAEKDIYPLGEHVLVHVKTWKKDS
ncbi:MAG: hypothetical protein DRP87_04150 [Spirochaetes bacterium]|nr:MAG: hypothetical protein DRP87_04150 [Spirochaetota bacterium]